ncbi:hypothetical protein [Azonexus sp.]|jgi:hypothetical protein|uniref:hypothetical protein n=1 Tax=Azonexus sp. TaxID=1872668 RepID=UPI0028225DCA|nr:hypothetical protein [Azonexus sp.]MDR1996021.1 hypothetical protein [Azonexus sp.]
MANLIYLLLALMSIWHIYGAAIASWHIARSEFFEPWQKQAQYLIAWLVPLLGTAFIIRMLSPEVRIHRPGWSLLEPIILASFGVSISESIDSASDEYSSSTAIPDQNSNSGNDD